MSKKPQQPVEQPEELTVDDVEILDNSQPSTEDASYDIPAPEDSTTVSPQPSQNPQAADANLAKITELTNDLQRTRADFENFRKQVDLQKTQAMSAARFATVEKFLPLLDDIDRAFSAYPEQLKPLEKNLAKLLQSLSLQRIPADPGVEFNPDFHDAVSVVDEGGDTEVILETLRPGYLYDGSVLRPAMVKVSK